MKISGLDRSQKTNSKPVVGLDWRLI